MDKTITKNKKMTVEEFLSSNYFKNLEFSQKFDLKDLIMELNQLKLEFLIIKNQTNLAFKITKLYNKDPKSQCNILTISTHNYGINVFLTFEGNEEKYNYSESKTYLIDSIATIYHNKI